LCLSELRLRDLSLRDLLGHRIGFEGQEPSELSGDSTDLLSDLPVAKQSTDCTTQWRAHLSEQISEETLRCELRFGLRLGQSLSLSLSLSLLSLSNCRSYGIHVKWQERSADAADCRPNLAAQVTVS
jgi:hypothetical protein